MTSRTHRPTPSAGPRPLVVGGDDDLLDDVLRLMAAAGATPEVARAGAALRRAHRTAPLVVLCADVLTTPAVRALPRRPGVLVVADRELPTDAWAGAVDVGAERVVVLPRDETWFVQRAAAASQAPVTRGWVAAVGGACGGAGASTVAVALALAAAGAADGVLLVDADGWGGGLDLLLGAESSGGLRWPDLHGLRGRVAGDALVAALPELFGVHLLAASRAAPGEVPVEALGSVVTAARDAGHRVVVDLPRQGPAADAVLGDADLAVLLVPARVRAASAARGLVDPPTRPPDTPEPAWSAARLVSRAVPGGLTRSQVADSVGRPVLYELGHDRSAGPRGERGEPPVASGRSPLGGLTRCLLAELGRAA